MEKAQALITKEALSVIKEVPLEAVEIILVEENARPLIVDIPTYIAETSSVVVKTHSPVAIDLTAVIISPPLVSK
jgi:hypothetical protein